MRAKPLMRRLKSTITSASECRPCNRHTPGLLRDYRVINRRRLIKQSADFNLEKFYSVAVLQDAD